MSDSDDIFDNYDDVPAPTPGPVSWPYTPGPQADDLMEMAEEIQHEGNQEWEVGEVASGVGVTPSVAMEVDEIQNPDSDDLIDLDREPPQRAPPARKRKEPSARPSIHSFSDEEDADSGAALDNLAENAIAGTQAYESPDEEYLRNENSMDLLSPPRSSTRAATPEAPRVMPKSKRRALEYSPSSSSSSSQDSLDDAAFSSQVERLRQHPSDRARLQAVERQLLYRVSWTRKQLVEYLGDEGIQLVDRLVEASGGAQDRAHAYLRLVKGCDLVTKSGLVADPDGGTVLENTVTGEYTLIRNRNLALMAAVSSLGPNGARFSLDGQVVLAGPSNAPIRLISHMLTLDSFDPFHATQTALHRLMEATRDRLVVRKERETSTPGPRDPKAQLAALLQEAGFLDKLARWVWLWIRQHSRPLTDPSTHDEYYIRVTARAEYAKLSPNLPDTARAHLAVIRVGDDLHIGPRATCALIRHLVACADDAPFVSALARALQGNWERWHGDLVFPLWDYDGATGLDAWIEQSMADHISALLFGGKVWERDLDGLKVEHLAPQLTIDKDAAQNIARRLFPAGPSATF